MANKLQWSIGVDNKGLISGLKVATKKVETFKKDTSKSDVKIGAKVDLGPIKSLGASISKLDGSKVNVKSHVDQTELGATESKIGKLSGKTVNTKVKVDDSEISAAESRLSKLSGSAGSGASSLSRVTGGLAVGGGLIGLFSGAVNLDTDIRKIKTVYGQSNDTMSDIQRKIVATSKEIGISTSDLSAGIYDALSSGIPNNTVFDFVKTASKTAIAGSADLNDVVRVLTGTVNAYGPSVLSAAEASDIFTQAVNVGVFTMPELVQNMSDITPIAAAMKVPLADASAWLAKLTKNGIPVAKASTMIKNAMSELSDSTSIAGKNFKQASGKTFPEFIKSGGNLKQAVALLEKQAKKTGKGAQEMFGSIEAGQAILGVTGDNATDFGLVLESLQNSAGATDTAFGIMNDGLKRKLKILWEDIKNVLNRVLSFVIPWALKFTGWIKTAFKWLMDNKIVLIGILVAIGTAITLWLVMSLISLASSAIAAVAALGPFSLIIGAIVLAIGGFVFAIIALYQKNEWFRNFVQETWERIKEIVVRIWNEHLKPALEQLKQSWENLVTSLKRFAERHPEVVEALKKIMQFFGLLLMMGVVQFFMNIVGAVKILAATFEQLAWVLERISDLWDALKTKGFSGKFVEGIKNMVPSWRGKPGGSATGGYISARMPRIVGERGIETIFPNRSAYVATAQQTEQIFNGGSNNNTSVSLSLDVSGVTAMTRPQAKQFAAYLIDAANDELSKRGVPLIGGGHIKAGV